MAPKQGAQVFAGQRRQLGRLAQQQQDLFAVPQRARQPGSEISTAVHSPWRTVSRTSRTALRRAPRARPWARWR